MTKTMHGKVHGRTIELDEDVGADDANVRAHLFTMGLEHPFAHATEFLRTTRPPLP